MIYGEDYCSRYAWNNTLLTKRYRKINTNVAKNGEVTFP